MSDFFLKAQSVTRESKQIEFKSSFDVSSNGEWCEIIKDIIALANSGGGIIVFGLNDDGSLSETSVAAVHKIDPADLSNKIKKYTSWDDPAVEICDIERSEGKLPAFIIQSVQTPLIFEKPGTYDSGGGKQKTAFGVGTVYFRHGAKSEPGVGSDIRAIFERQLNSVRQSWMKQVRMVSKAPMGSEFVISSNSSNAKVSNMRSVKATDNPKAFPVILTRNNQSAEGVFLHEQVSNEIFDEINNVIDANRILAKGRSKFYLGNEVYYRIYAERTGVKQAQTEIESLFHAGVFEFYAPNLFWMSQVSIKCISEAIEQVYLSPKGNQVHWLMRTAVLLGHEFSKWLLDRWNEKWKRYSQPPNFFFSFPELVRDMERNDARLASARLTLSSKIIAPGNIEATGSELLADQSKAGSLLSAACLAVFEGRPDFRTTARQLDYLAHGTGIINKGKEIGEATIKLIGQRPPGDFGES